MASKSKEEKFIDYFKSNKSGWVNNDLLDGKTWQFSTQKNDNKWTYSYRKVTSKKKPDLIQHQIKKGGTKWIIYQEKKGKYKERLILLKTKKKIYIKSIVGGNCGRFGTGCGNFIFTTSLIEERILKLRRERKTQAETIAKQQADRKKANDKKRAEEATYRSNQSGKNSLEMKYRKIAQKFLDTLVDKKGNLVISPKDGMFFVKQVTLAITRFDGNETKIKKYLNGKWKKNVQLKYSQEQEKHGLGLTDRFIAETFSTISIIVKEDILDIKLKF